MEREKKNMIARLQDFLETKQGQTILNYLYSWGAAIVILGALFKLTHIKGADLMLFVGMGTEVLVFFISGFDRQASSLGTGAAEEGAGGPIVIGGGAPAVIGGAAPAVIGTPGAAPVIDTAAAINVSGAASDASPLDAEQLTAMANLAAANAAAAAAAAAQQGPIVIGGGYAGVPVQGGAPIQGGVPVQGGMPVQGADTVSAATELSAAMAAAEGVTTGVAGAVVQGPTVIGEAPTIIGHGGTVDIPEVEKVTNEYIDRLRELSDSFSHVAEQAGNLEGSADEIERLSRNLTSINTIYELHLKSLGSQINNIDNVNEQTQRMAEQIEELNAVYKRMLESMTVNMGVRGGVAPTTPAGE